MTWLLNILLPGAALAREGRVRLGAALLGAYVAAMTAVLLAAVPARPIIPAWAAVLAGGCAGAAFAIAQMALHHYRARQRDPAWRAHLDALQSAACEHHEQGRSFDALLVVEEWLADEPRSVPAHLLRARILSADGKLARAAHAYRQLARVDRRGEYAAETQEALARTEGENR